MKYPRTVVLPILTMLFGFLGPTRGQNVVFPESETATGIGTSQDRSTGSFDSFAGVSLYFGFGTVMDSSNGQALDTFGTGTLYSTPKMVGLFGSIGGEWMLGPHWGIGFDTSFRPRSGYAGLNYRPLFYDFNAVYNPVANSRRMVPEFQGGLGGVNLRFYLPGSCDSFAGCSNANSYLESSNHFQLHVLGGVRVYLKRGFFIRPQAEVHWVNNFFQFGSNWVPEYTVAIGYAFGRNP